MEIKVGDLVVFNPLSMNEQVAPLVSSPRWLEPWERYRVAEVSECGTLLYLEGPHDNEPVVACWFDRAEPGDNPQGSEAKAICDEIAETARRLEELHQRLRRLEWRGEEC